MEESCKDMTAFTVGPLGHYRCERMPFGLTNAPATFQRLMETCLEDLHLKWCIIYLDDVIIFSDSPEDHLVRLRAVLEKLQKAGLKINPKKCEFFQQRIKYLGHIVSKDGIETDPEKISAVVHWPRPSTVTEMKSFLGFTNYYRKFIPRYAKIARPLNKLIAGENNNKKHQKIPWNEEAEEAFQRLKQLCSSTPVLAYADYQKPFKLFTDASDKGLGATLCQVQEDGKERPLAYASRSLSSSESRYDTHKLEFLSLKWAVTDRFHEYLYGSNFEVYTDNNPLTYILTTAKLDAMTQRWVSALGPYNFNLHYRSGKSNRDADALSRIDWNTVTREEFQAVTDARMNFEEVPNTVDPEVILKTCQVHDKGGPQYSKEEWRKMQLEDLGIGPVLRMVESETKTAETLKSLPEQARTLARQRSHLVVREGLLYRTNVPSSVSKRGLQFVLPHSCRNEVIKSCHEDLAHPGQDRTFHLVRDRFYWSGMEQDVRTAV